MESDLLQTQPSINITTPPVPAPIKTKRPTSLPLIFTVVFLLISVASTVYLAYQNNQQKFQITQLDAAIASSITNTQVCPICSNDASPSATTSELDSLISYELPVNWTKNTIFDDDGNTTINISSPNYKYAVGMNFPSGINIIIWKQKVVLSYTINNEDNKDNRQYLQDFKITTLAGKPAAYGFLGFEGYSDRYYVLNRSDKWTFYISYGGDSLESALKTKAQYKKEVDQFLNSLSFKN